MTTWRNVAGLQKDHLRDSSAFEAMDSPSEAGAQQARSRLEPLIRIHVLSTRLISENQLSL